MQLLAVFAEPTRLLLPTWTSRLDKPPKRLSVIQLTQVEEFVDDDVLEHLGWGEEKPPGEGKVAAARAGTPARPRVADPDRLELDTESICFALCHVEDSLPGLAAVPAFDCRVQNVSVAGGRRGGYP